MKPGLFATTALVITTCFATSVKAQTPAHQSNHDSKAKFDEVYILPEIQERSQQLMPPMNAVARTANALVPKAIATRSRRVIRVPVARGSDRGLLKNPVAKIVSPQVPPLPTGNIYSPQPSTILNGYIWPAQGEISSDYGWRWGRMHNGIDIAADIGTPIFAAASGVVIFAGWDDAGYGNLVEIQHPDGSLTRYGHANRVLVSQGQLVEAGQLIAEMGTTGNSTGPHLHFEVLVPGYGSVNPLAYLPQPGFSAHRPW